jgi:hypothetical protein
MKILFNYFITQVSVDERANNIDCVISLVKYFEGLCENAVAYIVEEGA